MRWDGQALDSVDDLALPGLAKMAGLVRSTQTPEFSGVTFHEIVCKSALSKVPAQSAMPFEWTINPTRGCLHQCTYCFARKTHEYLDLDAGRDFDTQIIVKTNIVEVLRRELARPSWKRQPVALGTNSDPYMRAEGRYKLMPGIIEALADAGTPFSILTKGPLLKRDLPLLAIRAPARARHASLVRSRSPVVRNREHDGRRTPVLVTRDHSDVGRGNPCSGVLDDVVHLAQVSRAPVPGGQLPVAPDRPHVRALIDEAARRLLR